MPERSYFETVQALKEYLRCDQSFDVVAHPLRIGERAATLFFVDGFAKDEILQKLLEYLLSLSNKQVKEVHSAADFTDRFITHIESGVASDIPTIGKQVLSGFEALVIEGLDQVVMIEARSYPVRGMDEPSTDRVMRGPHDGFVETLVFNTALIRRRIRDPQLIMEITQVGEVSSTDVVMCYMQNKVDRKQLDRLRQKIKNLRIPSLTMAQESLAECLMHKQWYNPFPKVRYTERPDTAASCLNEGQILVLTDNSAAAMIIPSAMVDFLQDTNDFCFPPLVGTYLRLVRTLIFFGTLLLMPLWYLLVKNPDGVPPGLQFLLIKEQTDVPILLQIIIAELIIDGIKIASLNTPNSLNGAFSVVGGLILGEFAVSAGIFVPEVLLYMAFTATATFTQPSLELGYTFKLFRLMLILLVAWLNWVGFWIGIAVMLILMVTTETPIGRRYLYPIIPFNGRALLRQIIRFPIEEDNS